MAKKYLSLEEAAQMAGMSVDEFKRLREAGEIRGFADRGTWKFKLEDVEEFSRSRQAGSDPDVRMLDESGVSGSSVLESGASLMGSSILSEDDDVVGEQATVIRGDSGGNLPLSNPSDSDVRLILDDSLTGDSDPEVPTAPKSDPDSDVRLVSDSSKGDPGSDSDVTLVGPDSSEKLAGSSVSGPPSDSDVQLVGDERRSSDTSESDVALLPSDSGAGDSAARSSSVLAEESGIALAGDSSISLASESGISLERLADSGISLERDSGITLADSGIALADDDDSITVAAGSSVTLEGEDSSRTMPMIEASGLKDDDEDTRMEVPVLEGSSEYELAMDDEEGSSANVILFDEDDAASDSATVKKSRDDEGETFDLEEDFGAGDEFGDDLVAADDIVGEDEELDDVFDAADEDFGDDFESGSSHAEFVAPVPGRMAAPVEVEWGTGPFVGLAAATLLMAVCGMMMFDLVRSMWHWNEPNAFNSAILSVLKDVF